MKKSNIVITILVLAAGGFFLWALLGSKSQPPPPVASTAQSGTQAAKAPAFEAQTNSEGGVEVEVQPLDLSSSEWSFGVGLNTHAGSLDADLLKAVAITDNLGDALTPIRWDGPPPGGHHRNGTLVFKAPAVEPETITVTVSDIGGVPKRTFTWQLTTKN